jgi:hypothetical protein
LNNGTIGAVAGFTTSNLIFKGNQNQIISGSGIFNPIGSFTVAANANVVLNKNLTINGINNSSIHGKLDLQNNVIAGSATLQTKTAGVINSVVTSYTLGSRVLILPTITGISTGMLVSGAGLSNNCIVISTSTGASSITISDTVSTAIASITISGGNPTISLSNSAGIDGAITANILFAQKTNFVFNAPTLNPFSIRNASPFYSVTFNASVTTNKSQAIDSALIINNSIVSIQPADSIVLGNGAVISGTTFGTNNHIATLSNSTETGRLIMHSISGQKLFPIGNASHYLPVTFTTTSPSSFSASVFEGITNNGLETGTLLSGTDAQTKVNAVWKLNRTAGIGEVGFRLDWDSTLEGSLLSSVSDVLMGVIKIQDTGWSTPFGRANNANNYATATQSNFGLYSIGSIYPVPPFLFTEFEAVNYGVPDFNTTTFSLNTAQPIVFTSSNPSVATVSSTGLIQIVGAGTTNIIASQQTDGTYPNASITRSLVVNKTNLTIKATPQFKIQGYANPVFTATYDGFVYGENESVLTTPLVLSTAATTSSPAGAYPIVPSSATSNNYNINFVSDTLTIKDLFQFTRVINRTYGDQDEIINVQSLNTIQPIEFTSSDPNVASITTNGILHIYGVGTTIITAHQNTDGTYPDSSVNITLIVSKKVLTINVKDTSKLQGDINPEFTISYSGFVLGENETNLLSLPIASTLATTNSLPGVYGIYLSNASSNNYAFNYKDGKMLIYPSDTSSPIIHGYNNNGEMYVNVYTPYLDLADILIYDMNGKLYGRRNFLFNKGYNQNIKLGISVLSNGIYVAKYMGKKKTITQIFTVINH